MINSCINKSNAYQVHVMIMYYMVLTVTLKRSTDNVRDFPSFIFIAFGSRKTLVLGISLSQ